MATRNGVDHFLDPRGDQVSPHSQPLVPARLIDGLAVLEVGADVVVEDGQGSTDGHVHVQILVGAQAAAEEDLVLAGLGSGKLAVTLEHLAVFGGVDRIVDLVVILSEAGVFLDDDGLVIAVVALRMEVTELVDAGVRDVRIVCLLYTSDAADDIALV